MAPWRSPRWGPCGISTAGFPGRIRRKTPPIHGFVEISPSFSEFDPFGILRQEESEMRHFKMAFAVLAAALIAVVAGAQENKGAPAAKAPAKPAAAESKGKAAVGDAKIEVGPETRDAGTVPKGQVIETTFVVKNNGSSDLIISDARPGCGCTVASFDKTIAPGKEGKVQTSVDTKSFSGPISKSVLLVSNDPERGQINLFIKANVKPFVDILPQPYVRMSVVKGDSDARDVILISEEKGFKPAIAEAAQPYVKAELSPAGEKDKIPGRNGEQYKLHITVTPDAPEGLLNAPIRVNTGVSQQASVEIPVSGIVRARVSVTPVMVNFGNFTAGKDPITRNIVVTNNKPASPIKVTKAEVSIPGFITDVVPTQEGISYTVVVKASDKVKKGALDGTVKLYTTDKDTAVIELTLKGDVL